MKRPQLNIPDWFTGIEQGKYSQKQLEKLCKLFEKNQSDLNTYIDYLNGIYMVREFSISKIFKHNQFYVLLDYEIVHGSTNKSDCDMFAAELRVRILLAGGRIKE